MSTNDLRLTHIPSVKVGMLIRRPPAEVFQAMVHPAITTKFWFTKSSGKMTPGADLRWEWEMYGVSTNPAGMPFVVAFSCSGACSARRCWSSVCP